MKEVEQVELPEKIVSDEEISDENSIIANLVYDFYKAFEEQNGDLLFSFFVPPETSEEKESYDYMTGAGLPYPAYRVFWRKKISNPTIESIEKISKGKFRVSVTDEYTLYPQGSLEPKGPMTRKNVIFVIVKRKGRYLIKSYKYELSSREVIEYRREAEKYNGFFRYPGEKLSNTAECSNASISIEQVITGPFRSINESTSAGEVTLRGHIVTRQERYFGKKIEKVYLEVSPQTGDTSQANFYSYFLQKVKEGNAVNRREGDNLLFAIGELVDNKYSFHYR